MTNSAVQMGHSDNLYFVDKVKGALNKTDMNYSLDEDLVFAI
ncbi:hypothetical protein [Peribacillus frigoritolerans]